MTEKENHTWKKTMIVGLICGLVLGCCFHALISPVRQDNFREDFKKLIWILKHGNFTNATVYFEFDGVYLELRRHD